jgi:uncharacterized protein YecE (DUF72 family)
MPPPAAVIRAGRTGRVLVGTSGFSYPAWRGPFYPPELPAREMLRFYARAFGTVEINNTFYRMPSAALLAGWRAQTPAGFRFALKAPQQITHRLRLRDAGEPTAHFCTLAAALGPRRGPLLFQLPPYLRADLPRLREFLSALPPEATAAFEFRHPTWLTDEVLAALADHHAALCIADTEEATTPVEPTAGFGYLRLRRETYSAEELDGWAARIRDQRRWKRVFVYFKHDEAGRAAQLARGFLERLE